MNIKTGRKIVQSLLASLFLVVSVDLRATDWNASAEPVTKIGLEAILVSVLIDSQLTGTLTVKRCESCEVLQLSVSPSTKFYLSNGTLGYLKDAGVLTGELAGIEYELDTMLAIAVHEY